MMMSDAPKVLVSQVLKVVLETIDDPGYVVRCMIVDSMKMFYKQTGREATVVHITLPMETLLTTHMRHEKALPVYKTMRDDYPQFMGMRTVYDSSDFKLE